LPFDDSRRLTGFNLYFADVGAVLETAGVEVDQALLDAWRARVMRMRVALGWPDAAPVARVHARGASLAVQAPLDQLFGATEVNEWALLASLFSLRDRREAWLHAPGHPAAWDEEAALHTLRAFARAERNPALVALVDAAQARGLTVLIDDDTVSVGVGSGARIWPLAQLPSPDAVDWSALHDAPIALVTGSNGKTTTTRLLAAFARAHGATVAYTSTDGVIAGTTALASGDYSGPAGARVALRAPGVDLAILETARGGILRRGIAVQHANVAVVTNVSDDHFGEYGVHDLDDLGAVKLAVARTLGRGGVLVLNADDGLLVRHAQALDVRKAWFALDADSPVLQAHREQAGTTCGVRDGHLFLHRDGIGHDLGAIARMPLGYHGTARYNIANIAAAALAADALGVKAATIATVLTQFGAARSDNPGRLQLWSVGGVAVFVDYAHNPDGLRGLLDVATRMRGGRLGLVLGQAGNREDNEVRELAGVAAAFQPDLVVLKDIGGMLRGRVPGEIPAILRHELVRRGTRDSRIVEQLDELGAVRDVLAWAREGDVLVLPIHGSDVKPKVDALLDDLQRGGWIAGSPLPTA
jgi:UDP-N-acetylmuramyl tripeptide synthase